MRAGLRPPRRLELVTLAFIDQRWKSERLEVSIGKPHREGFGPGTNRGDRSRVRQYATDFEQFMPRGWSFAARDIVGEVRHRGIPAANHLEPFQCVHVGIQGT